jgi:hypothetical protein
MKRHSVGSFLVLALASVVIPGGSVRAAEIPASPMDFQVSIDGRGMGSQPDCDPSPEEIGSKMMGGGSIDMTCVIDETTSNAESGGTVSNPTLAESDEGFNDGVINQTCDMDQELQMVMKIGMGENKMTKFKGKMFQACAWTMEFADAESSTLSGTMEMNGVMGSDDGTVADGMVTMTMAMKVYMVDGTGIFEGYTGGGEFTRTESMDMMGGGMGGGGGPGGDSGGAPQEGQVPSGDMTGPPADGSTGPTGPVQMPKEVLDLCAKNNLNPCDQQNIAKFCQKNMSACSSIMQQMKQSVSSFGRVAAFRSVNSAVRKFAEENAMTMQLKKGAGAVRILAPAAPTGQPKAPAVVKATSKIEIVATEGANCAIKTNRGKTIAAKVISSSDLTELKPKAGGFVGATSIKAVCKIGSATVSSNVVKVKLGK